MNAPNKIYVDTEVIAFYDLELKGKEDIEYIRKDALLEWAKDMVDEYERLLVGFPDNGSNWAKKRAFEELIEKLNSI